MYLGDFAAGATVDFKWNTTSVGTGSITRATNGTIRIYKDESLTQRASAAGITDTEDFDSLTGLHHLTINLADNTDAGFYAAGSDYQVVIEGMVVDGETFNAVIAHFSIENRAQPTASGVWAAGTRTLTALDEDSTTLDIDAAVRGAVGMASANLDTQLDALPTAAENADAVWDELQSGHVGAGTFGETATEIAAILVDTAEIGAAGAGLTEAGGTGDQLTAINLPDQTMNITGDITGNLSGSVGSVTGAVGSVTGNVGGNVTGSVGSVAAGGITAASIATDAIDADALAADAVTEIQSGLATAAALATVDGIVDAIVVDTGTDIPALIAALPPAADVTAIKDKTDSLTFTVAGQVDANIESVNGTTVTGSGTGNDPWGP